MGRFASVYQGFFEALHPSRCLNCGELLAGPGVPAPLCAVCADTLLPLDAQACPRCGLPREDGAPGPCPACTAAPPGYSATVAGYEYGGAVRGLIQHFKFGGQVALAAPLARLLLAAREPPPGDVLVPVPLHAARLRQRGYDQAACLAHRLGRAVRRPVLNGTLVRRRATRPQVGLHLQARRQNLAEAFAVRRPRAVAGYRVILVDDVMTTGATLSACTAALRAAGAADVVVWVLARAVRTDDGPAAAGADEQAAWPRGVGSGIGERA